MPDERRMSSIIMRGGTIHGWVFFDDLHGISVFGRGVFKDKHGFNTYAGQHKDGFACGLAVLTRYDGPKVYAELGPDGSYDGRYVSRGVDVYASYGLYERGKEKAYALVSPDGSCRYNREVCAPDDPRLLALIAQVAPVEVRPAAPAPHRPLAPQQPSDAPARSSCPCRRSRTPWPPRCNRMLHAVAGGRPCYTSQQQPQRKAQPRSDAFSRRFDVGAAREARPHAHSCSQLHPENRRRQAPSVACTPRARQDSFVPCHARRAASRVHASPCTHASAIRCCAILLGRFGVAGRGRRGQPASARVGARALRAPRLRTARRGPRPGIQAGLN
jgi:hypothetical protein